MKPERYDEIKEKYPQLNLAVVGDFCLDRYLEINPTLKERSIETGLPVNNVTNIRAQPGGAGTVAANLGKLGVGNIEAIGFCGDDGEGFELKRALNNISGINLSNFFSSKRRKTFTYCKPLVITRNRYRELSRLDTKNWTPTPGNLSHRLAQAVKSLHRNIDAIIVLEQSDKAETGVVTEAVRDQLEALSMEREEIPIIVDSRDSLRKYPQLSYKMNEAELKSFLNKDKDMDIKTIQFATSELAVQHGKPIFVTLGKRGIVSSDGYGKTNHIPALQASKSIDIVGAGDSVTANLAASLAAGATVYEASFIAMAAANYAIHQLGTTGAATPNDIRKKLEQISTIK